MKKKSWWKRWYAMPLVVALAIWLLSYWVTNLPLSFGDEKAVISIYTFLRDDLFPRDKKSCDSVVFINTTHDMQLMPYCENGDEIGNEAITDRGKLLTLMQKLASDTTYKYVLLDIFFNENLKTEYDSALFATIRSMPRIVVPRHHDARLAPSLLPKAAFADYATSVYENDFLKYPYISGHDKSIALKMYNDLTGKTIDKHGWFYFEGCRLSRSKIVLTFDIRADFYNNLGVYCDEMLDEVDLSDMYVVIGAIESVDIHQTYAGQLSGPEINFNAFLSLLHGHHRVSIVLALFYFLIVYYFTYKTLIGWSPLWRSEKQVSPVFRFVLSWFSYPVVLIVVCLFTFTFTKEVYDVFLTSLVFEVLNAAVILVNMKKESNKKTI